MIRTNARKRQFSQQDTKQQRFSALHNRNFVTLWVASLISNAGTQIQVVASIWLIVQFTHSPVALAISGLCYSVPVIFLSPVGGAIADRVDRITVIKIYQVFNIIQPLVMAVLIAGGWLQIWMLYADGFLAAVIYALGSPSMQAILPTIVRREDLLSAISLQSVVYTGATLVGPALGGVLLIFSGPAWLFAINGLTTILVLTAIFLLKNVHSPILDKKSTTAIRGSGARYIWRHKPVLSILLITALLTMIQGSYTVLLPFFASNVWHRGASGYGLLISATGIGTVVGALSLSALGNLRHKTRTILSMCLLLGVSLVVLAYSPFYLLGLTMLIFVGLASALANTLLVTQLQLIVEDEVRGRVMAFRAIAFVGVANVGSIIAGSLSQLLNGTLALTICAVVAVLSMLILIRPLFSVEATQMQEKPEILPAIVLEE